MTEKPTKGDIRRQRKYRRSLGMSLEELLAIPKAPSGQGSHKTKRRAEGRKRAAARGLKTIDDLVIRVQENGRMNWEEKRKEEN